MSELTLDEFFEQLPKKEHRPLTNQDLKKVLMFSLNSAKIFSKDDITMTKSEKITAYKEYCNQNIKEVFSDLDIESKRMLDDFFNTYGTGIIIKHLTD